MARTTASRIASGRDRVAVAVPPSSTAASNGDAPAQALVPVGADWKSVSRKTRLYDTCIVGGCGHVGLPLGLALAECGQRVVLYDINPTAVDMVNRGVMPFMEEGSVGVLAQVLQDGRLVATYEAGVIAAAEALVVVVGTPVDEHLNPRLHDVIEAIGQMLPFMDDNQLLVLRSTLFPGATRKIFDYLRANGRQNDVVFCPERTAEGKTLKELRMLPQIVSGFSEESIRRAAAMFSILTEDIVELTPIEAELAKLFTNTWRYVNFAVSNQFYMIAQSCGVDFYRVYEGMIRNYPRLQGFARAGFAAGPCLFKDTMQLSAFANNRFFMGHAAMLVNEGMPNFVVEEMKQRWSLREKTVGILGMGFKANHDDPRESLSYKLKKILELEAKRVLCSDVYIKEAAFVEAERVLELADIIILGTPHREYGALDYGMKPVIDIWNFLPTAGRTP